MTNTANRTNPGLWEKIKSKIRKQGDGRWSARKAQQAVREYKKRGGGYTGQKSGNNSLRKWTNQSWKYVNSDKKGRYLPARVIEKLTPEQKRRTNRNKRAGTRAGKNRVPYDPDILRVFNKYK